MNNNDIPSSVVVANNTCLLMAYVVDTLNNPLTQTVIDSITLNFYELDLDDNRTSIDLAGNKIADSSFADTLDKTVVIHDTLQTPDIWKPTSAGFNFSYKIKAPALNKDYEARVTITTTSGDTYVIARRMESK